MDLKLRKRHRIIWVFLSAILLVLFVRAVWIIPKPVIYQPDPLPPPTLDTTVNPINSAPY